MPQRRASEKHSGENRPSQYNGAETAPMPPDVGHYRYTSFWPMLIMRKPPKAELSGESFFDTFFFIATMARR